jgi:Restriction endonuclease
MNSYIKGAAFENQVYVYLKEELYSGRLLVNPATSSIYHQKSYYSQDRDKNISTDISIEVSYEEGAAFALLIVVECKDYNNNVPVDDIEEFHSKVAQISGLNVKAIFVTTAALQTSAFKFALAKKMTVIRILPDGQVQRLLHFRLPYQVRNMFSANTSRNVQRALTVQAYTCEDSGFFGMHNGLAMYSWSDLFKQLSSE